MARVISERGGKWRVYSSGFACYPNVTVSTNPLSKSCLQPPFLPLPPALILCSRRLNIRLHTRPRCCSISAARAIPVDYATLAHCVAALTSVAVPAKVESVQQPSSTRLVLALRTLDAAYRLSLSFSQTHGRLAVLPAWRRGDKRDLELAGNDEIARSSAPRGQYSLCATARALLQGTALVSARVAAPFDRVATLEFAPAPGARPVALIYLELLGNGRSNIILTDGDLSIKACGRQVSPKSATARALQTGVTYVPPRAPLGMHPTDPSLADTLQRLVAFEQDSISSQLEMDENTRDEHDENSRNLNAVRATSSHSLSRVLVRTVAGVSPALARVICNHANVDPDCKISGLRSSGEAFWVDNVVSSVSEWYEAHTSPDRIVARKLKSPQTHGVIDWIQGYELEILSDPNDLDPETIRDNLLASGGLIERYYFHHEVAQFVEARVGKLTRVLDRRIAKARARAEVFAQKVSECDGIDELRRDAQILHSFAHTWTPGDTIVRGEWIDPCMASGDSLLDRTSDSDVKIVEVRLSVDGKVEPIEYGQQLYRKADKLSRARDIAESRYSDGLSEVDWLEGMLVSLSMVRTVADIAELEAELVEFGSEKGRKTCSVGNSKKSKQRAGRNKGSPKKNNKAGVTSKQKKGGLHGFPPSGVLVLEYSEVEVLVGRNARGNETVTFELAKKSDIWLHAAGVPGAHVVARRKDGMLLNNEDTDDPELKFAADVAAFFSKSSQGTNVAVSVLRAGDVRRAPGSPRRLGSVLLSKPGRTMFAKPLEVQVRALAALSSDETF